MSRLDWMGHRRPRQLLAAASEGRLYYADATLMHRSDKPCSDIPAHRGDADIVADFIIAGLLRRDETGAITPALQKATP